MDLSLRLNHMMHHRIRLLYLQGKLEHKRIHFQDIWMHDRLSVEINSSAGHFTRHESLLEEIIWIAGQFKIHESSSELINSSVGQLVVHDVPLEVIKSQFGQLAIHDVPSEVIHSSTGHPTVQELPSKVIHSSVGHPAIQDLPSEVIRRIDRLKEGTLVRKAEQHFFLVLETTLKLKSWGSTRKHLYVLVWFL